VSRIHELSFEDAVASLRDTYKALDIRALLIKEATEWICIFLVITNTADNTNELISKYKNKNNRVKIPNLDNLKVILESRQIDQIDSLINDIKNGFFSFGQIKAKLVNNNCKDLEKGIVKVENTYSNNGYSTVALLYPNNKNKSPLEVLTDHRINAKNFGLSQLIDIRIWFDVDLSNTIDFIWIFPIYSKITSKYLEDNKALIP
jgi:hypothetical protein